VLLAAEASSERQRIKSLVGGPGVLVSSLEPGEPGDRLWQRVSVEQVDVVIAGRGGLPDPIGDSVRSIRDLPAAPDVIFLSADGGADERAQLLAAGCLAVLDPGLGDDALRDSFRTLFERRREEFRLRLLDQRVGQRLGEMVSSSPLMRNLLAIASKVAASDTTLLILGETGTGKEWLARAIHADGPRTGGPFIAVNCGAIPEGLLESELFGHRKGAFTGAVSDRRGHFELAHGGTLFLDEIGEMPARVQVKLLRALQERAIQPVGGERTIEVDVRVMASTNRDPQEEMNAGRLRQDLYYRLGVVTLAVPPLRERREDVAPLLHSYFEHFRSRLGRAIFGIASDAMRALLAHDWPGNVRELINVTERAVLLCDTEEITLRDLPAAITAPGDGRDLFAAAGAAPRPLDEAWLEKPLRLARREVALDFERRYLSALLQRTGGRIAETAQRAGLSPRALFDRMQRLGLRKEDFRPAGSPAEPRSEASPPIESEA
jgi:DNA-binding NtrC family response regulator